MQVEASQRAILHALDRLNLIGELQNDDYQLDRAKVRRFFQRASVQQIAQQAQALLQQGASIEQVAEQIVSDWGVFLMDAVQVAAGDGVYWGDGYEGVRGMHKIVSETNKEDGQRRIGFTRIPIDLVSPSQRLEVERYLYTVQNKTREDVEARLRSIAEGFGGKDIEFLLNMMKASRNVEYYSVIIPHHSQPLAKLLRLYDTLGLEDAAWVRNCPIGFLYDVVDPITIPCRGKGFVLREKTRGYFHGDWIIQHITGIIRDVWKNLGYWTYGEITEFLLFAKPLPLYVGYAIINFSSISLYTTSSRSVKLSLIPCLSAETVEQIYKQVVPRAEPRTWALMHEAHDEFTYAIVDQDSPSLSKKALKRLLAYWNRHAPPEWRYTSQHAEKVFRKALRNARRAIDGAKE